MEAKEIVQVIKVMEDTFNNECKYIIDGHYDATEELATEHIILSVVRRLLEDK